MHILVGAGSATFVGVALLNTHNWQLGDVNRVPAGVASGVGFLGAGTIFKIHDRVTGLTTAAGLWIVAAVGYAVAAGYWYVGLLVTALVLFVQFGCLFCLSPRFWKDLREKFRLSYEMEVPEEDAEHERQSMLFARSGEESSDNDIEAIDAEPIESGKSGIFDRRDSG